MERRTPPATPISAEARSKQKKTRHISAPEESVERCRLLSRLVRTVHMTGAPEQGGELVLEAVSLARRLNDLPSLFDALACEVMHVGARPLPADKFPERGSVVYAELAVGLGRSKRPCSFGRATNDKSVPAVYLDRIQ